MYEACGRRPRRASLGLLATALCLTALFLNASPSLSAQSVELSGAGAAADARELRRLLEVESSYAWLTDSPWRSRLDALAEELEEQPSVAVVRLRSLIADVLGDLGDRHLELWESGSRGDDAPVRRFGELPVGLIRVGDGLLIVRKGGERYQLVDPERPFLEAIDGVPLSEAIDSWTPEHRPAPESSRLALGAWSFRRLGQLRQLAVGETVRLTLADGRMEDGVSPRDVEVDLVERGLLHADDGAIWARYRESLAAGTYEDLFRELRPGIAYMAITEMESLDDNPKLRQALRSAMERFSEAKALILDVRGNFGGTRDILWELAPFIVPAASSPWVANVAYVRSDQRLDEEMESMSSRHLLPSQSDRFDDTDREAISRFLATFEPRRPVPRDRFSEPYVMLLHSGEQSFPGHVYLLADDLSTSAATVFVAALGDLPNVTLAGVRTNGSSGRSRYYVLPNSGLELRLSTMVSYQRDGRTLDGNGTPTDLEIDVTLEQRPSGRDLQLEFLVDEIERRLEQERRD